jgi:hypothetical protein
MKRLLAFIPVVLLTGCLNTPVARHFPEVPEELKTACPSLEQVDPTTTKLSEVVRVVTDNYTQYHECRVKVDAWIEWYKTQRSIFEEVK